MCLELLLLFGRSSKGGQREDSIFGTRATPYEDVWNFYHNGTPKFCYTPPPPAQMNYDELQFVL